MLGTPMLTPSPPQGPAASCLHQPWVCVCVGVLASLLGVLVTGIREVKRAGWGVS